MEKLKKELRLFKTLDARQFKKSIETARKQALLPSQAAPDASDCLSSRATRHEQTRTPHQQTRFSELCRTYLTPEALNLLAPRTLKSSRQLSSHNDLTAALHDKIELDLKFAALKLEWKHQKNEWKRLMKLPANVRALETRVERVRRENQLLRQAVPGGLNKDLLTAMTALKSSLQSLILE